MLPNNLAKLTNKSLDSVNFSADDNSKLLNNLDPNNAHGHDKLSIGIKKLCENSICKPLSIIFNDCLKEGNFPSDWKKAHVVPVHMKGDKPCLKNYRPISLPPIYNKMFERLIYNELFTFFIDNKLIPPNQSGFGLGDFCVGQLLANIHDICKLSDDGLEVRKFFVWHEGLLLKLSVKGITNICN